MNTQPDSQHDPCAARWRWPRRIAAIGGLAALALAGGSIAVAGHADYPSPSVSAFATHDAQSVGAAIAGDPVSKGARQAGVGEAASLATCIAAAPIRLTLHDSEKAGISAGQPVRGVATSATGCNVEVTAVRGQAATGPKFGIACEVTVTPIENPNGDAVNVKQTGDCDGIGISVRIDSDPGIAIRKTQVPSSEGAASLSPQWVDARTIALDPVYYPMIIVSSQINWQYDGYDVYEVSYPTYQDPDSFWYLVSSTEGSSHEYPPIPQVPYLQHYLYTHWYSDGFPNSSFPDTEAWIQPTAYGYATGGWSCGYYHEWQNQYPRTSFQDWCNHYP